MKTDAIEFDTQKTVQEIANVLRSQKCDIEQLTDDPLAGYDSGPTPVLAVLLAGKAKFSDAFKHPGAGKSEWGVQVVVYEFGNKRHVEMIALGESGFRQAIGAYAATGGRASRGYLSLANAYFNIRHSKDYRDQIAQKLKSAPVGAAQAGTGTGQQFGFGQSASSQPASYSQLSSSSQSPSTAQSTSAGYTSNPAQNLDPAASQNFASLQEMIKNFENKQGK